MINLVFWLFDSRVNRAPRGDHRKTGPPQLFSELELVELKNRGLEFMIIPVEWVPENDKEGEAVNNPTKISDRDEKLKEVAVQKQAEQRKVIIHLI